MITLAWGAASHPGEWPVQEDGFWVDPARGWMVLADGAGGPGVGDVECQTVIQRCVEGLEGASPGLVGREAESRAAATSRETAAGEPAVQGAVRDAVPSQGAVVQSVAADRGWCGAKEIALRGILERECARVSGENGTRDPGKRAAVSVMLAEVSEGRLHWASGGGVAAVVVRGGSIIPLVAPQVFCAGGVSLPLRAVGVVSALSFQCGVYSLQPGDVLVAWSSGFPVERGAFPSAVLQALGARVPGDTLQPLAEQLVEAAWAGEGLSAANRTCVLAEWPAGGEPASSGGVASGVGG